MAGHAQVAADDDVAVETEEEVLAHRVDRNEAAAVDPLGHPRGRAAWMGRLRLEALADENSKTSRRTVERISLGHDASVVATRRASFRDGCAWLRCDV